MFDYIESTYKSTSAITEKQTIDWAWPATDGAPRYPAKSAMDKPTQAGGMAVVIATPLSVCISSIAHHL